MQNEVEKFLHVFYLKKNMSKFVNYAFKNVSLSFFRQTLFFLELNQQKFKIVAQSAMLLYSLLSWKRIFSKCRELEGKCKFCIGLPSITDLRSLKFTILTNFCMVYFPVKTFWVERWGFPHLTIFNSHSSMVRKGFSLAP